MLDTSRSADLLMMTQEGMIAYLEVGICGNGYSSCLGSNHKMPYGSTQVLEILRTRTDRRTRFSPGPIVEADRFPS